MSDPNFRLAVDNGSGQVAVTPSTSRGAANYNGDTYFPVSGTTVGTTYELFMIAWDNRGGTLTTPALATAANAWVGWSSPFSYTPYAVTVPPTSFMGLAGQFGVTGIPEPSILALAGLGSLSVMMFRRRKPGPTA